jgi:hypothetical protein
MFHYQLFAACGVVPPDAVVDMLLTGCCTTPYFILTGQTVDRMLTCCCNSSRIALKSIHGPPPRCGKNGRDVDTLESAAGVRSTDEERTDCVGVAANSGKLGQRQKDARDLGGASTRRNRNVLWAVSNVCLANSEEDADDCGRGGARSSKHFQFARAGHSLPSDPNIFATTRSSRQHSRERGKSAGFRLPPGVGGPG